MERSTIVFCFVCLVSGVLLGVILCQPEIYRQRSEISSARAQVSDLQTQVDNLEALRSDLTDQVGTLQGDLEYANTQLQETSHRLEILENAVEYLSSYVEKDLEFLSPLLGRLENYQFADLDLLVEIREASHNVDPSIAATIDAIIDDIETLQDWAARMPPENAPYEERYTWLMEGYPTIGRYLIDYREFVKSFLEPIKTHLEAVRGLSLAD